MENAQKQARMMQLAIARYSHLPASPREPTYWASAWDTAKHSTHTVLPGSGERGAGPRAYGFSLPPPSTSDPVCASAKKDVASVGDKVRRASLREICRRGGEKSRELEPAENLVPRISGGKGDRQGRRGCPKS